MGKWYRWGIRPRVRWQRLYFSSACLQRLFHSYGWERELGAESARSACEVRERRARPK